MGLTPELAAALPPLFPGVVFCVLQVCGLVASYVAVQGASREDANVARRGSRRAPSEQ